MVIKHQHFEMLKKTVLERLIFKPPLKAVAKMYNEASFNMQSKAIVKAF